MSHAVPRLKYQPQHFEQPPLFCRENAVFRCVGHCRNNETVPVLSQCLPEGSRTAERKDWFGSALADAGIKDYTGHCNRHTFAGRLVMAGVDLRTVGELLGHKSLSMTMRYSHLAPAHNAAAVDRLVSNPQNGTGTTTDTGVFETGTSLVSC